MTQSLEAAARALRPYTTLELLDSAAQLIRIYRRGGQPSSFMVMQDNGDGTTTAARASGDLAVDQLLADIQTAINALPADAGIPAEEPNLLAEVPMAHFFDVDFRIDDRDFILDRIHAYGYECVKEGYKIARPADAEPVAWRHWWRESPGCEVGIVMALENPPANNSSEFPHYVSRSAEYVRSEPLYTVQIWHSDASPPSPDRTQGQAPKTQRFNGLDIPIPPMPPKRPAPAAAQADALPALAELVACRDLKNSIAYRSYKGTTDMDRLMDDQLELKNRQPLAWAEAGRVIAATGGKK